MALRSLNSQEMITVSTSWVDPAGDLPVLEAEELLIGPARVLTIAHRQLVTMNKQVGSSTKRADALTAELTDLDAHHDRKARGVHDSLGAAADLADDSEQAEAFQALTDKLFPQGLQITQQSYRAQAGAAQQVREHLDQDDRDLLATIVVAGRPLLDAVDDWLDTAVLIGQKVDERARLTDDDDDAVTQGDLRDARLDWIRAAKALLTMLEFTDLDDEQRHDLLANLREAERLADARNRDEATDTPDGPSTDADQPFQPEDADSPEVTEPV